MASEPTNPIISHVVGARPEPDGSSGRGDFIDPPGPSNARVARAASDIRAAVRGLTAAECASLNKVLRLEFPADRVQASGLDRGINTTVGAAILMLIAGLGGGLWGWTDRFGYAIATWFVGLAVFMLADIAVQWRNHGKASP